MTNRGFTLLLIVLLAGSGIVFAQSNPGAEQLYSSGIHAFNSQRYAEAINSFDQLEAKGSQDPRAFFFRGLAQTRLGDTTAANADYETAAKLELTVAGRSFSVPKALERIQGRERTTIEQHRRAAKRVWEAEENMRRQDEFLSQKAENQKLYQTIIDSGKTALPPAPSVTGTNLSLPFGAQPVAPFGATKAASQPKDVADAAPGGLSDDNIFKDDVERVTVFEEPEPPTPKTPPKPQDPGERGVFDIFGKDDDDVDGFDTSALLGGSYSTRGYGMASNYIGSSVAETLLTDENGSAFGKGFANLFKKSGSSETPFPSPSATPSIPAPTPDTFDDSLFDDTSTDDNPFGGTFSDDNPFGEESF